MTFDMESICGSTFWNQTLSWQAERPDLTPCFQETILIWVPCVFLWLFTPYEIYKVVKLTDKPLPRRDGTRHRVPWTPISVLKVALTVVLILLALCQLTSVLSRKFSSNQLTDDQGINQVYPVDWLSPLIQLATFILALGLTLFDRANSISSTGLLFLFWLMLSVTSAVTYYSIFVHLLDSVSGRT